jgi:hypothetical protein
VAHDNEHWRSIRGRRARPPGAAGAVDERRLVFQSALAQAEELWDAAAVAGPRSRALPLFYCVSQAGRAICAPWTEADVWEPRGHGLSGIEPAEGTEGAAFVAGYGARIDTRPRGAFGMVAEATASAVFSGTATLAQLWTSMPMFPTPRALVGELPRCLYVDVATAAESGQDVMQAVLAPTHVVVRKPPATALEVFAPFPSADGAEVVGERASLIQGMEPYSIVAFRADDDQIRPLREVAEPVENEDGSMLPRQFVFRPSLGEQVEAPPSQLMTMWALLFALSQLTRYYPAGWVRALDADESEIAVTLDHGLELVLDVVPRLISQGLSGPIDRWIEEIRQQQAAELEEVAPDEEVGRNEPEQDREDDRV